MDEIQENDTIGRVEGRGRERGRRGKKGEDREERRGMRREPGAVILASIHMTFPFPFLPLLIHFVPFFFLLVFEQPPLSQVVIQHVFISKCTSDKTAFVHFFI